MERWTSRKISAAIRRLNIRYGEERYMYRNDRIYERDIKKDVYRCICKADKMELLIQRSVKNDVTTRCYIIGYRIFHNKSNQRKSAYTLCNWNVDNQHVIYRMAK